MTTQTRDQAGRFAGQGNAGGATAAAHTPAGTANGGAPNISSGADPAQRGAASNIGLSSSDPAGISSDPAAIVNKSDVWGNLHTATDALVNRPTMRGRGQQGTPVGPPPVRDYSAGFRTLGLGSGESAGQVGMQTRQGPSQHGRNVPGSGVPGPADPTPTGGPPTAAAGGADAAGSELAELAPLAAL